ncbi:MAG: serine/threonine-protein kinase [Infirmifilum sp.]
MLELVPKLAHALDSPVRSLISSGGVVYAVTEGGVVYQYEEGVPRRAYEGSNPRLAVAGLGGLIYVHSPGEESVVQGIWSHGEAKLLSLPRLGGLAASERLLTAWYGEPGRFLQSSLTVLQPGEPVAQLQLPKVLCATCSSDAVFVVSIDGKLRKLVAGRGVVREEWSSSIGVGCDWAAAVGQLVAVKRGGEVMLYRQDLGTLVKSFVSPARRYTVLDGHLLLWDIESPNVTLLDASSLSVRSDVLEPVYGVLAAHGKFYVLMRWKLALLSEAGELLDAYYLPVPLAENICPGKPFLLSIREWIAEVEPEAPWIQVRGLKVEPAATAPQLQLELGVIRPGSQEPLEDADVRVELGGEAKTLRGGAARVTLAAQAGKSRLTVSTVVGVTIGRRTISKRVEFEREVDIPAAEPLRHVPGDLVGEKYRLLERLGSGGFGTVYRARDIVTDRLVAVKIPHGYKAWEDAQEEIVTEAMKAVEVSRRLNDTRRTVVEVFEAGVYTVEDLQRRRKGKILGIAMEYCGGGSLRGRLESGGVSRPISLAADIAEKTALLNKERIVHGDLKPENILFTEKGELLLADFYSASLLSSVETVKRYKEYVVTEGYAPPELVNKGEVSLKTDVYSVAVITVELLTGQIPRHGTLPARLLERWHLPSTLVSTLADALSGEPERRPSVEELAEVLKESAKLLQL